VLWGDFDGTLAWFRELWHKAERLPHKPEGRKLLVASCRSTQSALEDGLDSEGTRTELRCGRSSTIIAMDFGLVTLLHEEDDHIEDAVTDAEAASTFVSTSVRHDALPTSSANNQTVSVFELNHEAGNVQSGNSGHDITFSTLIYLVNTAQTSIDLVMGYFQLFPALHDALTRAAARGVTVRLLTNSSSTHGLPSQSKVFGETIGKLLKLGIEVYVPDAKVEGKEKVDYTLHYKVVVVDGKAGMFGSWNCIGTSIFFDADYSVVLFSHDDGGHSNIFDRIKALFHDSSYTRLESISKGSFEVPFIYKLLANKYGRRVMERGY
jgi:PLD-like domain